MEPGLIATIVVAALIFILLIIVTIRNSRIKVAKDEAKAFINGHKIEGRLYNKFTDLIKNYNYSDNEILMNIENTLITLMKKIGREYIESEISAAKAVLSKRGYNYIYNSIDLLVDNIIDSIHVFEKIEDVLRDRTDAYNNKIAEEDKELDKEYSNSKEYYEEEDDVKLEESSNKELIDSDDDGLEKRGFTVPSKEEEAQLNPQVEEEEPFNADDNSMEVLPEGYYYDSKGRLHDKSGKYAKKFK